MRFWKYMKLWFKLGMIGVLLWELVDFLMKYSPKTIGALGTITMEVGPCLIIIIGISILLKNGFGRK